MDATDYLATILPKKVAKSLGDGLGLHTVADLLTHFPRRYLHGRLEFDPDQVQDGDTVMVRGVVSTAQLSRMRQRRGYILRVTFDCGVTTINAVFFHPHGIARVMQPGAEVLLDGEIKRHGRFFEMSHPNFLVLRDEAPAVAGGQFAKILQATTIIGASPVSLPEVNDSSITEEDLAKDGLTGVDPALITLLKRPIIPVYAATAGVSSWLLMVLIDALLAQLPPIPEVLPETAVAKYNFPSLDKALRDIHHPHTMDEVEDARERLLYDEAAAIQTVLLSRRYAREQEQAPACSPVVGGWEEKIRHQLPYTLTSGQEAVLAEISEDLQHHYPMNRLLQGEVGSGKTVVALLAMAQAVDNGQQAVLLAPTEVLAAQHERSIRALLGPLCEPSGVEVVLLRGGMSTAEKRIALLKCMNGDANIIIGTQALLQDTVEFMNLGLVVIDEQHRFGVEQRAALQRKGAHGQSPHLLVMTATPIPRTIALTSFGDLSVSTLQGVPAGRADVQTTVVNVHTHPQWEPRIWERICEEVSSDRQAYIVAPAIGENSSSGGGEEGVSLRAATVTELYDQLTGTQSARTASDTSAPLAGLRVGLLHGRLEAEEKRCVMDDFTQGNVDVLVCTTVIEVGIDVPNATMMVIWGADRFGVSQLHQLRGRVGRGQHPGLCLLVTECSPESTAAERLHAIESTRDGFALARIDLQQRREGDLLGTAQAGMAMPVKLLDIVRDEEILDAARGDMIELMKDPQWTEEHPRWAAMTELMAERQGIRYPF